jgi:hypothetical protein
MAACPTLGLLVTSDHSANTLDVFTLPSDSGAVTRVGMFGDPECPVQFNFGKLATAALVTSGYLVFTGPATSRLLLVTDAGHDAVHVIDVARQVHVGYVAAPGTIAGPRGVAARGSLVAVSAWKKARSGESATTWRGCLRAVGHVGQRCACWLAALALRVIMMRTGSCKNHLVCASWRTVQAL